MFAAADAAMNFRRDLGGRRSWRRPQFVPLSLRQLQQAVVVPPEPDERLAPATCASSTLLGIDLMPRIRNIRDLTFFRPGRDTRYQNIQPLCAGPAIDWDLIARHYEDMLRVAVSIEPPRSGCIWLLA
jgi:hypothetical protein